MMRPRNVPTRSQSYTVWHSSAASPIAVPHIFISLHFIWTHQRLHRNISHANLFSAIAFISIGICGFSLSLLRCRGFDRKTFLSFLFHWQRRFIIFTFNHNFICWCLYNGHSRGDGGGDGVPHTECIASSLYLLFLLLFRFKVRESSKTNETKQRCKETNRITVINSWWCARDWCRCRCIFLFRECVCVECVFGNRCCNKFHPSIRVIVCGSANHFDVDDRTQLLRRSGHVLHSSHQSIAIEV